MRTILEQKTNLLVENRNAVIKALCVWYNENLCMTAAYLFTEKNMVADVDTIKQAKKILKKNVNAFSNLRSYAEVPLIAKMAMSKEPETYLEKVKETYYMLRKNKFSGSNYLALTAMFIVDQNLDSRIDEISQRTAELYHAMKKEHPILTGQEDISMAALLACTGRDMEVVVNDMESCYRSLKKETRFDHNSLQSLCEVLATNDSPATVKTVKVLEYYEALKNVKKKFNGTGTIPALGMLVNASVPVSQATEEIAEVDNFLKKQKGFSVWHINKDVRLMFAGMLVADSMKPEVSHSNTSVASTVSTTIAMEIAITVAIILCSVAAANAAAAASH